MRIVHVGAGMLPIPPPGYGAVERHIAALAAALEARGHAVTIVNRALGAHGIHEYAFALWARRELARSGADVIHVHTPGVAAVFAALGPRRFIFTTHSRHWTAARGPREQAGFWLERRAVRHAAEVIAVSPVVRERIGAAGIRRAVHVIPHGVDGARFAPAPVRRRGAQACCVAEVAPHKGQHVTARAVRGTPWSLRIAGPIRDRAYAAHVRRIGGDQVELLGALDESGVVDLLQTSALLVHPSVSESFGMAVLEGMAAGLAVLAGELVADRVRDGEHGFLVPETLGEDARVARYREHLAALAADPSLLEAMGRRSRERALAEFGWDRVAARLEPVYKRFASESAGSGAGAGAAERLRRAAKPSSTPAP